MLNNVSRSVARVLPRASIVSSRAAHTDKEFPNLEYYRMKGASGIVTPTEFHEKEGDRVRDAQGAAYMMTGTVAAVTAFSAGNFVWKAVSTLNPTRSVRALASIEVEIGDIPVGKTCMFKWRGKPIFIKHRDEEEIAREAAVDVASLRDPQADTDRFINPEWLVCVGICTHLGCIPIANAGNYNGYFCPCHGSHYDGSGRIRQGPAPLNLEVPPLAFNGDASVVTIG
jgi:ubiquinol-cytochrome c reductase iron-sulfur subunit